MISPRRLRIGDTIGILAPGKKISSEEILSAVSIFESWGLQVRLGSNLFSNEHGYLSSSDEHRRRDLQAMIDDPSVHAIACARGGYGTTRILDQVDFSGMQSSPKWIIGFSDITALHLKLFQLGIESIHGTMPLLFSKPESAESIASLKDGLFTSQQSINIAPDRSNRFGVGHGKAIGGNLSLIADSLGTSSQPDASGCILILEEVDEYIYKLDRMLIQLTRSNILQDLAGLAIGHMTDIKDSSPAFGETFREVIMDKVKSFSYPVAFGFPTGHENPNLAWVHGGEMTLAVTAGGSSLFSKILS